MEDNKIFKYVIDENGKGGVRFMEKTLIDETIDYIITKKENFNEEIDELIYKDIMGVPSGCEKFTKLTYEEIQRIETLRKKIYDAYILVDKLEEFRKGE